MAPSYLTLSLRGELPASEASWAAAQIQAIADLSDSDRSRLAHEVGSISPRTRPAKFGQRWAAARQIAPGAIDMISAMIVERLGYAVERHTPQPITPLFRLALSKLPYDFAQRAPTLASSISTRLSFEPSPEPLRLALERGAAGANGVSCLDETPLTMAARAHYGAASQAAALECLRLLLRFGADPNQKAPLPMGEAPPLWVAARHDQREAAALLLEAGADPFASGPDGTPILDIMDRSKTLRDLAASLRERRSLHESLAPTSSELTRPRRPSL